MSRQTTYPGIIQTTFDTPLVKLNRIIPHLHATVLLKLEFFNPFASVKDRIGRAMIEAAEKAGIVHPRKPKSSSPPAATRASPWPSWPRPRAIGSR